MQSHTLGNFPNNADWSHFSLCISSKKRRNSPVFQVWHGVCNVFGMKRDGPADNQIGDITMTAATNNLFAAAFSIAISAGLFAYAIVPASPTMFA